MDMEKTLSTRTILLILIGLSAVSGLTIFLRICITALAPDIEAAMQISPIQVSFLGSMVLLGYGLMQIPAGLLTDSLGGRNTLMLFLVMAGGSTILVGATNFLSVALAGRFITGMAISVYPSIVAILAVTVPAERFASAMGITLSAAAIGVVLGGTPLALLNQAVGWKMCLFISGGMAIGLMFMLGALIKKPVPQKKLAPKEPVSLAGIKRNLLLVFRNPKFWPLAIWQMCMGGTFFVMAAHWWTNYLMGTAGLTKLESGHVFMAQALLGILTIPLLGELSTRLKSRKKVLMALSFLGLAGSLSYVFLAGSLGLGGLIIQGIIFATGTTAGSAIFMAAVKETFPPQIVGTAVGCSNMFYPIYAAIATPVFGMLFSYKSGALQAVPGMAREAAQQGAYSFAAWVLVGGTALGLVMSFLVKESYQGAQTH